MRLLEQMAPDNGVGLLSRLAPERARRLLERLPARARERLIELLRYPEDTAGGLMTNAIVTVPGHLTVSEARRALREPLREPDFVGFVYVVDDERSGRLRGVLSLRDLLVADEHYRVENVMNPYLERLHPLQDAGQAARQLLRSELPALPVVGADDRLLGALTFDVALAVVLPESQRSNVPRIFS
jgi:Mg/Co/Ni transporter MgtE